MADETLTDPRPTDPVELAFWRTTPARLALIPVENVGTIEFNDAIGDVEAIRAMAQTALQQDANFTPREWEDQWRIKFAEINSPVEDIENFTLEKTSNPLETRNQITARIAGVRNEMALLVTPYAQTRSVDIGAKAADAHEALGAAKKDAAEINELLNELKIRSGEVAGDRLAQYFDDQATAYRTEARNNLRFTVGAIVLFTLLVIALFWKWPIHTTEGETQWEELIRGLVPRLLVLGLAGYALSFFSRNYRVARHQQAVNEHKRNILDTYPLFLGSSTPEGRDLITAELVRRVFEHVDTGYISEGGERLTIDAPTVLSALRPPGQ